jgi:TPR repeat protein
MPRLCSRLLDGGGMSANPGEGFRWLKKAADAGDSFAMSELGQRLLDGCGLPKGRGEGLRWLRRAAEMGDEDAEKRLAEEKD